ncbi:bifunctional metallophosphatase/5'-nucleotidase [Haloferax mediterranei ATCC 33500]|uniref:2', 3'-cyclic nucleotide 2'-phosphodiesterase n=1 Tax=Haloferax mediterranei (strain ATCC 33500 / DSM 1411 / JCM 8866 / NBRC 14739 / NCIMB 2177 / R-4) TaxID=523841 RepID=I3R816_HALMT|nr:5'-nucleotidase C-terminal domain-containing protein [Haloferax mediterranei]AFK20376.1 5'-nucleotidase; 2',3'-cyclic-nucleotide 2'-phosphodiesterase; UDP-sugar hydrolase [Haloferax mediterranei ATCC 33500]AHZ23741.1 2', 3'-cyclic nucleotide 2'-phosphodiesterase [Haloferax mediterranei ATCC 33500]ELZ99231.1 5'-nucleotidase [Haloferax mediterranei ATCC 33500]MDX5986869.1 5'-nucleotidase C-terminal domain-containing protein [Haloferax mediterranei ATCC 33500]QCQ76193.1 bifunctional metallopho
MPRLLHYSDIENVFDDPLRAGRLAGCVSALDDDHTLVVGSGDNTSPGVLSLIERGGQALDFYHAVDADFETFGNHDFDYGPTRTRELVSASRPTWVTSNVYDETGDRFGAAEGTAPWATAAVDGLTLGFFGVTDPATESTNPEAVDLTFTDPYEAAADAIAALREEGVDAVVALSHLGSGDDELARRCDVDLVLGGHVHAERDDVVDGVPIVRPGANGHVVWEVRLDDERIETVRHRTSEYRGDESLVEALHGRVDAAGLDEVLCRIDQPMDRTEETVAAGECRVGNAIADAYRWATEADVGLQNSGGIRSGPPVGPDVTHADIVSLVPFEEHLVVAEVTGEELLDVFNDARGSAMGFGEPEWWHAQISGARIVWDDDRDEVVEAFVDGDPIDSEALYTVATSDYLLHSSVEFSALTRAHRAGEFEIQHDAVARYAREVGFDAEIEGRIERRSSAHTED